MRESLYWHCYPLPLQRGVVSATVRVRKSIQGSRMCLHRGSAYRQTISSHTPKTEYRLLVGERELCAIIREKHCDPWSQRIMEYCIIKFMKFEGSSAWKQGKDFSFKCPILQEMKLWDHQSHRHSSTPLPKPVPALFHHSTHLESHGDFLKNVWVSH